MITGRGYTLLPLQGEDYPVMPDYPGCRFACPGLSARWAFSPLHLMAPLFLIFHIKLDTLLKESLFIKSILVLKKYETLFVLNHICRILPCSLAYLPIDGGDDEESH